MKLKYEGQTLWFLVKVENEKILMFSPNISNIVHGNTGFYGSRFWKVIVLGVVDISKKLMR